MMITYLTEEEKTYTCPDMVDKNGAPCLVLPNTPYQPGRPTVAVLLNRTDDGTAYESPKEYVKSLQKENVNLRFISYEHVTEQLKNCDAVFLPGGVFASPPEWEKSPSHTAPDRRFRAYETLIKEADKKNIPLMGICAGFQMALGVLYPDKMHLYPVPDDLKPTHKQSKDTLPHTVTLAPGSTLEKIFGAKEIKVNSSHSQCVPADLIKDMPGVHITALAGNIVESYALDKHPNWIAVQWHPEVLADLGNKKMQGLFHWFAKEAETYGQTKVRGNNHGRS